MPSKFILTPIESDRYFHIYNRGNNFENIFFKPENYIYFLKKYKEYLFDHVETYAYCLLPNHFHLLVKVTNDNASSQFRKFFQSYALSINKQEGRTGSLFAKVFKRIKITNDDYLKRLVFYIHYNPEKHSISDNFKIYPYNSYQIILSNCQTSLERNEVFEWFGSKEEFIDYHTYLHGEMKISKCILED